MAELDKRQQDADAEKHRAAVKENKATLFNSPHQVVLGNPQGNVTMVEFFDYNCGFCKRAMTDMLDLMKTDPNLKFVLKEFPVLGPGSVEAAHVAVAARMQDPTGKKYIEFHQKLLGGRGPADKARALAVAKEVGFDMARLEKDMESDEVKNTIDENMKLADALGVNGTPSYVVGDAGGGRRGRPRRAEAKDQNHRRQCGQHAADLAGARVVRIVPAAVTMRWPPPAASPLREPSL